MLHFYKKKKEDYIPDLNGFEITLQHKNYNVYKYIYIYIYIYIGIMSHLKEITSCIL